MARRVKSENGCLEKSGLQELVKKVMKRQPA